MFVLLLAVSIVIGALFNWSLLVDIMTNENASNHWTVIFFDFIFYITEVFKVALVFATVLNLSYYGFKRFFQTLKIV